MPGSYIQALRALIPQNAPRQLLNLALNEHGNNIDPEDEDLRHVFVSYLQNAENLTACHDIAARLCDLIGHNPAASVTGMRSTQLSLR